MLGEISVSTRSTGSSDGINPDGCYLDYSGYQQLTRCYEYYIAAPRWTCPSQWFAANTDADGNITRCYQCATIDLKKNLGGGSDSSCQQTRQFVGNPIHSGTGNKYQAEADYSTAGEFPLQLTRHYNSQANTSGGFGANWSAFPAIRVADANNLTVIRPDQKAINYTLTGSVWTPDADIPDTLIATATGYHLTTAAGDLEDYNATGKLLSITDRAGRTQTLHYDTAGRLSSVSDANGRSLTFTHDPANRIATVTDPAGGVISYTYDAAGNLSTVTYPDGTSKTYHYEDPTFPHALTGITDENGQRFATYAYDAQGRAILSEHAGSAERVELVYHSDGSTTVTDALGTDRAYGFQTVLGVVKGTGISQPGGAGCGASSSAVSHDANGNVARSDDFNGHRTRYWHDLVRNLETTHVEGLSLANGNETAGLETRTLTTEWHPDWRLPTAEKTYTGGADSAGQPLGILVKTVTSTYDTSGNLLTRTETDNPRNESRTWTFTWYTLGRLASADGPRTDVQDITTYAYYPDDDPDLARRGQLWKITNALGHITEILAYDLHGHPTRVKDPNNLVTDYTYTARNWLKTRLEGDHLTTYSYDNAGQLTRVDLPDGAFLEYTYDAAHRLTGIRNAQGDHIQYALDAQGNILSETVRDAQGNQASKLTRQYDALGRLWKEIRRINGQDAATEYGYDAQGNRTLRADPLAHATRWRHDALDRLAQTEDALQGHTDLTRDVLDQITTHSDPKGLNTTYEVDAFGQVRREVSPDRGITTYTYDAAGNLKTRSDARGRTTTYFHDALNRVFNIRFPTGGMNIYLFRDQGANGLGRLTGMIDESGTTAWTHTPHGEVAAKTHTAAGSSTHNVGYTYLNGRLTRLTYPSGAYVDYTWSQGRITEIRLNGAPLLTGIQYQPFGAPQSWTWGNGLPYTKGFDPETGWPLSLPLGTDTRTLAHDAAGRLTGYTHTTPGLNQSFDYDAQDRLSGITTPQGNWGYQYDPNGNRTLHRSGNNDYLYTFTLGSNRLQSVTGPVAKTYQYDTAGNVIHDGTYAYTYNDAGRLASLTWHGQTTSYRHDGLGARTRKTGRGAANGEEHYVHDEDGKRLGDYAANGARLQETLWLDDQPVAVLTGPGPGTPLYVHADHLNAPRVLTDTANRIVWRWDGDAFGVGLANEDPDGDGVMVKYSLRFPGQHYDGESGLHDNYFRGYDPRTGRYTGFDLIGLGGGANGYAYVGGNPLSRIDPLGLAWDDPGNASVYPADYNTPKEPSVSSLTPCEMKWLNNNYGMVGGFITDAFNLQQYLPSSPSFKQSVETGVEVGVVKGGLTKGVGTAGKAFSITGMQVWGAISSITLEAVGSGFASFATTAKALASKHCSCGGK